MADNILVDVKNICKSYGPTKALVNVCYNVHSGEIRGLIGENGSGKSTLSSIIAGIQRYDTGEMLLSGQEYKPANVLEANSKGLSILVQEQGTFENISVAANIFIGYESQFANKGVLSVKKLNAAARKLLNDMGITHIKENLLTSKIPFEDRKLIELARAMHIRPTILIVDETTTALNRRGRDILYRIMHSMRDEGRSVIFISHDIDEVMSLCDYVTILRDGHSVSTLSKAEFGSQKIKQLMVGREISENFYRQDYIPSSGNRVAMEVENVTYGLLKDVSLTLRHGEILGIGGLADCGMHDLGKIMFGLIKPDKGSVRTGSGRFIKNQIVAIRNGIGYISKDRDGEALMVNASIKDNICLPSLKKLQQIGLILARHERPFVDKWIEILKIKMENMDQHVMYLSGGNKQKVSVAKWLAFDSDVFIFDCPTRGIDVGVKSAIYQLMLTLKKQGKALLMISEELTEVIGMSDRILILKNGILASEFMRDEMLTESQLIEYMI